MPTVAEVIAQTLVAYGTEKFFCLMGGDHDLWIALHDAGIEIVNCRTEAGATYMADGYARVSGRPGFVYGQRGPGVANVASALPDALWAGSPVISLTSSINMAHRDRYEYQELDGIPMNSAVTKWNKPVSHPSRAAAMLRAAVRVATGPAPGPVHLEIPADMFRADAGGDPVYREESLGTVNARRIPPEPSVMRRVVERLAAAERPLLVAGKGVIISEAWEEFTRLAHVLKIPAVTTLGGKGAIDEDDDLAVGVMGRSSRIVANKAVHDCDVVLALGTRFGGLPTANWALPFEQKVILQIDTDPAALGQNYRAEITVLADAKRALQAALDEIVAGKIQRAATSWTKHVQNLVKQWRIDAAKLAQERPSDGIHPAETIAQMRQVMRADDIVGADTGALGSWIGGLFPVKAGKSVVRADGSLGWVVPGAMGAKLAAPHRRVVALTGDGGLLYHISELETALRYNIPVVIVVLNNRALASEYHSQRDRWRRIIPEVIDFRDVDFASVARSFGAYGVRVDDGAQFADALRAALAADQPALIDVVTSKETAAPRAHYDAERIV